MSGMKNNIAPYKILPETNGVRFSFRCALSGMDVCRSSIYKKGKNEDVENILKKAWDTEGRFEFNQCCSCGKWVSDIMYNADVLKCVKCAPWEDIPEYCPMCGTKVTEEKVFCEKCGVRLLYGGDADAED